MSGAEISAPTGHPSQIEEYHLLALHILMLYTRSNLVALGPPIPWLHFIHIASNLQSHIRSRCEGAVEYHASSRSFFITLLHHLI